MRTAGKVLLQVGLAAALFGVLVWRIDLGSVWSALRAADWRWAALGLPFMAGSRIMGGINWWVLVRRASNGKAPLKDTVLVQLVAGGVNDLLPLRAGAAVQMQVLRRRYGIERTEVGGTLIADGLLDAVAFLAIGILAAPLLGLPRTLAIAAIAISGGAAVAAALVVVLGRRDIEQKWLKIVPKRYRRSVGKGMTNISDGFAVLGDAGTLAAALATLAGDWVLAVAGYWFVGKAFGIDLSPFIYFVVEVASRFIAAIRITQSNLGTYELAVHEILTADGANSGKATAFAFGSHAALIVTTIIMSIGAAAILHLGPKDLFFVKPEDEEKKERRPDRQGAGRDGSAPASRPKPASSGSDR